MARAGRQDTREEIWAIIPKRIPTTAIAAGIAPGPKLTSAASRAGMINEKKDAESITPAAKPSDKSRMPRLGVLPNSTGIAPTAVMDPAMRLPRKPSVIGDSSSTWPVIA